MFLLHCFRECAIDEMQTIYASLLKIRIYRVNLIFYLFTIIKNIENFIIK
jgi:hypothetical protein